MIGTSYRGDTLGISLCNKLPNGRAGASNNRSVGVLTASVSGLLSLLLSLSENYIRVA